MKKSPPILILAFCAAGISSGLLARRLTLTVPEVSKSISNTKQPSAPLTKPTGEIPRLRSSDTVETLTALTPQTLYSRLALWLVDASEQDISAFWEVSKKGEPGEKITELIFLHWARHNPQAAIAAAPSPSVGWRAWACHDPQTALATARGEQVEEALHGIAEFHPQWLRQHFEELPQEVKKQALEAMVRWPDHAHPKEHLQFLTEHARSPDTEVFQALAQLDPWAAMEWTKHPSMDQGFFSQKTEAVETVVHTLARDRPEDLKRMLEQAPSDLVKLKMEAALFSNLIKSDRAAALELAKSTPAPRVAAERYAALGQSIVRSDAEQAFQMARDLFTRCPDALNRNIWLEFPAGGERELFTRIPGIDDFATSLMDVDPARFLDMVLHFNPGSANRSVLSHLTSNWADRDLAGFTHWLNQQTDESIRKQGAGEISSNLLENGFYEEAAEWGSSRFTTEELNDASGGTGDLSDVFEEWMGIDPEGPARWLESANLPADRQEALRAFIRQSQ